LGKPLRVLRKGVTPRPESGAKSETSHCPFGLGKAGYIHNCRRDKGRRSGLGKEKISGDAPLVSERVR